MRPALVGVAIAAAIACTAGAATLSLREGAPLPEAPAGDFSADQQPLPESARLAGVQTADNATIDIDAATPTVTLPSFVSVMRAAPPGMR